MLTGPTLTKTMSDPRALGRFFGRLNNERFEPSLSELVTHLFDAFICRLELK